MAPLMGSHGDRTGRRLAVTRDQRPGGCPPHPWLSQSPPALLLPGGGAILGVIQGTPLRLDSREHSVAGDRRPALSPPETLLPGAFSPPLPPHAYPVPTKKPLNLPPPAQPQFLRPHPALWPLWPTPATSASLPTQAERLPLQSQIPADPSLLPVRLHPGPPQPTPSTQVSPSTAPSTTSRRAQMTHLLPPFFLSTSNPACLRAFAPTAVPAAPTFLGSPECASGLWFFDARCLPPGTVHSHAPHHLSSVGPLAPWE